MLHSAQIYKIKNTDIRGSMYIFPENFAHKLTI